MISILLLFTFIVGRVFAAMESGQNNMTTELSAARDSVSYPLPFSNERTKYKTGQNGKGLDSGTNATGRTPVAKVGTLQRQVQDSTQPTTKPAVFLRWLEFIRRLFHPEISSNQTSNHTRRKLKADQPETDFRKQLLEMLRKVNDGGSENSSSDITSNTTSSEIISELPSDFEHILSETDKSERLLLLAYANNSGSDVNDTEKYFENYKQARQNERKMLQELVLKAGTKSDEIVAGYKALRSGVVGTGGVRSSKDLRKFFETPSLRLKEYEAVKREDRLSMDGVLNGSLGFSKGKSSSRKRIQKRYYLLSSNMTAEGNATTVNSSVNGVTTTEHSHFHDHNHNHGNALAILATVLVLILVFAVIGVICVCMYVIRLCQRATGGGKESEQTPLKPMSGNQPSAPPLPSRTTGPVPAKASLTSRSQAAVPRVASTRQNEPDRGGLPVQRQPSRGGLTGPKQPSRGALTGPSQPGRGGLTGQR